MNAYMYVPDSDRFSSLSLPRGTYPVLDRFDGRTLASSWTPLEVHWQPAAEMGDFPSLVRHVPVFTDRAWNALEGLVGGHVEHLPLKHGAQDSPPIAAVHVLPILDCLDEKRSEVRRFEGRIVGILRYAFIEEAIAGFPMFRIKGYELAFTFVNQAFRDQVEKAGLRGLIFRPLP